MISISPFKNYTEEEKRKALNRILLTFGITVFLLGSIFAIYSFYKNTNNYYFLLNGERMDSIMICENVWHYEKMNYSIPCVINQTIGAIMGRSLNWSLSPVNNCEFYGGEFPGFNIMNSSRAKEIYDSLMPKCFEMDKKEITNSWLKNSNCTCSSESIYVPNCDSYYCEGGLIIER